VIKSNFQGQKGFDVVGGLCSKLLNTVWPEAVDERALNRVSDPETELTRSQSLENNTLFLKAAGSIGCSIPSVTPEDLADGKVCFGSKLTILEVVAVLSSWMGSIHGKS
jgi:Calponin homology (CH) domain